METALPKVKTNLLSNSILKSGSRVAGTFPCRPWPMSHGSLKTIAFALGPEARSLCRPTLCYGMTSDRGQDRQPPLPFTSNSRQNARAIKRNASMILQSSRYHDSEWIPAVSTRILIKRLSTCSLRLQSKRKARPQSLDSSRGVGINLAASPALKSTASACMADELLWNRTTPNLFMRTGHLFQRADHFLHILQGGRESGCQADGAFRERADRPMRGRRAVQSNAA